jgi:hypothetical protein
MPIVSTTMSKDRKPISTEWPVSTFSIFPLQTLPDQIIIRLLSDPIPSRFSSVIDYSASSAFGGMFRPK